MKTTHNTESAPSAEQHIPDAAIFKGLSYGFARDYGIVFLAKSVEDGGPILAYDSSKNMSDIRPALYEAKRVIPVHVAIKPLDHDHFEQALTSQYGLSDVDASVLQDTNTDGADDNLSDFVNDMPASTDLLDSSDEAPIIRLLNGLIADAVKQRSSDIHIEPYEQSVHVRMRVDGVLTDRMTLPHQVAPTLVSRIKVMSRLDIAEKRIPQDGRLSIQLGGRALDLRVSTLPSRYGERVVMRILDRAAAQYSISDLGMDDQNKNRLERLLHNPNGIILVTGPTGSGKTTTLYASLSKLNDKSRNILTVEDPVEYAIDGIGQTQVNNKVGMTFAAGLKAMLRQDPDVVMVGEIRDKETADIAVQASLTGHLVLSTVHTNSAAAAITRLKDMGIESFLLASSLKGIIAQRLVRRLCPHCKAHDGNAASIAATMGTYNATEIYKPVGCTHCHNSGYQGRIGLYEIIEINDSIAEMIHNDASDQDIHSRAFDQQNDLQQQAYSLVASGQTSWSEIIRVIKTKETSSIVTSIDDK